MAPGMSIELFLLICFIITLVIHLLFLLIYIYPFAREFSAKLRNTHDLKDLPMVAIIIAARNEEDKIENTIRNILHQNYPQYTIHVVDDYSTDNAAEIIKALSDKNPIVHYHLNALAQGKKQALRHVIESVNSPILLFTDADCIPASENWIKEMVLALGDKDICLGYGKYRLEPGFMNKFIQFETGFIAAQYMAFAERYKPYMGVGRNLMYRRKIFMESDRFESHADMRSGDDDLFIVQYATKENTTISLHPDSFTLSEPPHTFLELFKQKRRHLTTSVKYPFATQLQLAAISTSNMYFYLIGLALLIFFPSQLAFIALMTFVKWVLDIILYRKIFHQLQIQHVLYLFPLLDIVLSLYYFILAPFLIFRKTETW